MTDTAEGMQLPSGPFAGIESFQNLVRQGIQAAQEHHWNEMIWCDASFEDWPLRERAVIDLLNQWAQRGRKLTLMAYRFDSVQRLQHRFVDWRIRWDHIIECRVCRSVSPDDFPSALWSPQWALRRVDPLRSTGVCGAEADRRVLLGELLKEMHRKSAPGFPASVLGL